MTNRTAIVRSSIWRTLQQRGIVKAEADATHERVRDHAVPDAFEFRGIPLTHPYGPPDEIIKGVRLERLNEALQANNNKPVRAHLATVAYCTRAYTALWNRTKQGDYDPTPVAPRVVVEHVTPKRVRVNQRKLTALEGMLKDLSR